MPRMSLQIEQQNIIIITVMVSREGLTASIDILFYAIGICWGWTSTI